MTVRVVPGGRVFIDFLDRNSTGTFTNTLETSVFASSIKELTVLGNAGNDTLTLDASLVTGVDDLGYSGLLTRVQMYGGSGNDTLIGSSGSDFLYGGDGDDILWGRNGHDVLVGGAGSDQLFGENGDDFLLVDEMDPSVTGGLGYDVAYFYISSSGQVSIGNGTWPDIESKNNIGALDHVFAFQHLASKSLIVFGTNNTDQITLNTAGPISLLTSTNGVSQTITAPAGGGSLYVENVRETFILGNDGNEVIQIISGSTASYPAIGTKIFGGYGNDTITGSSGNDILLGEQGDDILAGGSRNDLIVGGSGSDQISGGVNDDYLMIDEYDVTYSGNEGYDVVDGRLAETGLTIQLSTRSAESARGSRFDDILDGSNVASGNLLLSGNEGSDMLIGSVGADTGIAGNGDWISFSSEGQDQVQIDSSLPASGSYTWTQLQGPAVLLQNLQSSSPYFVSPWVSGETKLSFRVQGAGGVDKTIGMTLTPFSNPTGVHAYNSSVTLEEDSIATLLPSAFPASQTFNVNDSVKLIIKNLPTKGTLMHYDGNSVLAGAVIDITKYGFSTFAAGSYANIVPNLLYKPNLNLNGQAMDSVSFSFLFNGVESNVARLAFNVTPVNDMPIAEDDFYELLNGSTGTILPNAGALSNDSDVDGDFLTASLVTGPSHGTVAFYIDGSFQYTPGYNAYGARYFGTDTFTYKVSDGRLESRIATINLSLVNVETERAPKEDGTITTGYSQSLGTYNNTASTLWAGTSYTVGGDVVYVSTAVAYLQFDRVNFPSSFSSATIRVYGNSTGCDTSLFQSLSVGPTWLDARPTRPLLSTFQPLNTWISRTFVDPVLGRLNEYSIEVTDVARLAENPSLVLRDLYTQSNVFNHGYILHSQESAYLQARPRIVFTVPNPATNIAPVSQNNSVTVNGDRTSPIPSSAFRFTDANIGDQLRAVRIVTLPGNGQLKLDGIPVIAGQNIARRRIDEGALLYTPPMNQTGTPFTSLTYSVSDGVAWSSTVSTLSINVNNVSKPPYIQFINNLVIKENDVFSMPFYVSDADSDYINVTATSTNASLLPNSNISVSWIGYAWQLTVTPAVNQNGRTEITLTASDGTGNRHLRSFILDVWPWEFTRDDGPISVRHTRVTSGINVRANDDPFLGKTLTMVVTQPQPSLGEIIVRPNQLIDFYPKPGLTGLTQFTYYLTDGLTQSRTATVTLNVVNTPPSALDDSFLSITHSRPVVLNVLANDSDGQQDPLLVIIDQLPVHGGVSVGADGRVTYKPDPLYVGPDQFSYHLSDGFLTSRVALVNLQTINHAPVANSISLALPRTNILETQLTSYNSDADTDELALLIKRQPLDGRVTIHDHGHVLYERWSTDLNPNWTDSFTYTLFDGIAESNEVSVTYSLTNSKPVPGADFYRTDSGRNLFKNVLTNDYDSDLDKLRVVLHPGSAPSHAQTFRLDEDGTLVYVPVAGYTGSDSFQYDVYDAWPTPGTAFVTIDVANLPPTTYDRSFDDSMDDALTIDASLLAMDSPDDVLSFRIVSDVTHGLLSVNSSGPITYLPNPGFIGTDFFTYSVSDGVNATAPRTVTINVKPPVPTGWAPYFYAHANQAITSTPYSLLVNANDSYASGDLNLTASLFGATTNGFATINSDGTFVFSPNSGFVGTATFQYKVYNGYAYSQPIVASVYVGNPTANSDTYYSSQSTTPVPISQRVSVNDSNPISRFTATYATYEQDWSGLSFELVPGKGPTNANAPLIFNADGTFIYTQKPGFSGSDSFSYRIMQGAQIRSQEATVTINVASTPTTPTTPSTPSANVPPVLSNSSFHVRPNLDRQFLIPGYDANGDRLTLEVKNNSKVVDNGNGTFVYRPAAGFTGLDNAAVRAFDGIAYSDWTQWVFDVSNQLPKAVDYAVSLPHKLSQRLDFSRLAFDSDADELTFTILTQPANGTLSNVAGNRLLYTYTSNAGFAGADTIVFSASDGIGSATGTITINVTNNPPKTNWTSTNEPDQIDEYWVNPGEDLDAVGGSGVAKVISGEQTGRVIGFNEKVHFGEIDLLGYLGKGSPKDRAELARKYSNAVIGLTANDFDADYDSLKVELVRNVEHGVLELTPDGSFYYEPNSTNIGLDSFTYRITDGIEWSLPTTVLIHIQNAPPVSKSFSLTTGRKGTISKNSDDTAFTLPGNSRDPEWHQLTYSVVVAPTKGTLTINADGSFQYKNTDGILGNDSFTYRSFDGTNYSLPATVTVSIKNESPTSKSDSYVPVRNFNEGGLFDAVYSVIGDLPVSDVDNDLLSLDFQSGPLHGTFTIDADGRFVYKPTAGFIGEDSVVYRVTDGLKSSGYAQLKFTSKQTAPRPVIDTYYASSFAGDVLNAGIDRSVLRNDVDDDNQALQAVLWKALSPGQGSLTFNSDGTFQYAPQGFIGTAEFSYIVTDGITKSLPAKVKIIVQPAKFEAQSTAIEVDVDQVYQGAIAPFQFLDPANLGNNPIIQISGGASSTGSIRPTGRPAGQPQWEIVPTNLKFTKSGKQVVSVTVKDAVGRVSTTQWEFSVLQTAPKIVGLVSELPASLSTSVNIASFQDSRNLAPTSYKVRINWGDGSESEGVVQRTSPGNFLISGVHSYDIAGPSIISIELFTQDGLKSTATLSATVSQQLILSEIDSLAMSKVQVLSSDKLAFFSTNAPQSLVSQLVTTVYWGDGTSSQGTMVSVGADSYEVHASHNYSTSDSHRILVAVKDPNGAISAYTANPTNPSAVFFTQPLGALTYESTVPQTLVQFYGNLRGDSTQSFGVGINWNDSRLPKDRTDLVNNNGWYKVVEPLGYGLGNYQPNLQIRLIQGTSVSTVASGNATVLVGAIEFQSSFRTMRLESDAVSMIARFTSNQISSRASDFAADILWSDGVASVASINLVNGVFEISTKRDVTTGELLTAKIHVRSAGILDVASNTDGLGEGEQSSTGTVTQAMRGASSGFLPIQDISMGTGCPNMFKLFVDDDNYQVDSTDDNEDAAKVKQIYGGQFGRFVQANLGDENRNKIVDFQENSEGVTQLTGPLVPLSMSFSNADNSQAQFSLNGWNEQELRIWKRATNSSTYSLLHPGTYTATQLGIPNTGGSATFYIEGLKESIGLGDKSISGTFGSLRATVKITVGRANLVVDGMDEILEKSMQDPGAVVIKNSNFTKQIAASTGQTETGVTKYIPDYLIGINEKIDPNFAKEFTKSTINISDWMVQAADIKLSFDSF